MSYLIHSNYVLVTVCCIASSVYKTLYGTVDRNTQFGVKLTRFKSQLCYLLSGLWQMHPVLSPGAVLYGRHQQASVNLQFCLSLPLKSPGSSPVGESNGGCFFPGLAPSLPGCHGLIVPSARDHLFLQVAIGFTHLPLLWVLPTLPVCFIQTKG